MSQEWRCPLFALCLLVSQRVSKHNWCMDTMPRHTQTAPAPSPKLEHADGCELDY